jgi:hypothetical protein
VEDRRATPKMAAVVLMARLGSRATYNAVLLLMAAVAGKSFKVELPNYGAFDEKRVSRRARRQALAVRACNWACRSAAEIRWTSRPPGRYRRRNCACPMARRSRLARKTCG